MPTATFTEDMLDVLRVGRNCDHAGKQHILAMDLMVQEAALSAWIAGWDGVRSPRDIAHDGIAAMRQKVLVRSYEGKLPLRVPAERVAVNVRKAA